METLALLEKLVAFPSVSAESNLAIATFCRDHLSDLGFSCRLVPDATGKKANLIASLGPSSGDGLVLSGHMDVVPVEGQVWTSDPFRLTQRDGRVHGRGATDMKGFLASALAVAEKASRLKLARPLHIALSHDEEIGCVGVRGLLDDLAANGFRAAVALVGEPTGMHPVIGHKGKLAARATCRGVPGHSSLAPLFLNAIHLACEVVGAIRDVQARLVENGRRDTAYAVPYSTTHAGIIRGGDALNVVATEATVDFEIRHLAEDDARILFEEIVSLAQTRIASLVEGFPDTGVDFAIRNAYPGLATAENSPALAFVRDILPEAPAFKVSFGTEAGLYVEKLALPTVVIGPGDMAQGHQPDEFITLDQLAACDAFLEQAVQKLASDGSV
ncbi:acetylornithine deacetylase (plasmid) [Rhizobium sp. ACO-34A]|nr:acetylornithine deacetylase [Rhizobium sp. ACO-34A]ATN37334.1 acetylornithine deacetylase [Rhizobium sp. ACO-34A]